MIQMMKCWVLAVCLLILPSASFAGPGDGPFPLVFSERVWESSDGVYQLRFGALQDSNCLPTVDLLVAGSPTPLLTGVVVQIADNRSAIAELIDQKGSHWTLVILVNSQQEMILSLEHAGKKYVLKLRSGSSLD